MDAVITSMQDIKGVFEKKEILTSLGFVIKKAFDCITETQLISHLKEQEILLKLIQLIGFF